jgi:acetyl esterase
MASTPLWQLSPQEIRAQIDTTIMDIEGNTEPVKEVSDVQISGPGGGFALRTYRPEGGGPLPVVVYVHGAGWVAGNLDTHDNVCRYLCNRVPCAVVSVGYRLAPEHRFPAAIDDAYSAAVWAANHAGQLQADTDRLAVAGDSAGGNLAAAVCLRARDQLGPSITFQLLVNPALDWTAYDAAGFEEMKWCREQYLNGVEDYAKAYASPVLADNLSDLPQTFIITGEEDVLRDEGERYARKLTEAGVFVNIYCQKGMGHLSGLYARAAGEAQEALDLSVAVLRAALNRRQSTV